MRDILEIAQRAEPDDRALSAAYADYLLELGDPRGELIRLQLLAEDDTLSADDRAALDLEIEELLRVHGEEWLGGLADLLLRGCGQELRYGRTGRQDVGAEWWFERGWLAGIDGITLGTDGVRALASAPQAAMLRDLSIDGLAMPITSYWGRPLVLDFGIARYPMELGRGGFGTVFQSHSTEIDPEPLNGSPHLANLRRFRFGMPGRPASYGHFLDAWVRAMPRLSELDLYADYLPTESLFAGRTYARLTAMTMVSDTYFAVSALAGNPTTARLRRLSLSVPTAERSRPNDPEWEPPEGLPREEVVDLLNDGAVPALKYLRLSGSTLGDRGIEAMLKARFIKRLTELELTDGCLTDAAADMLAGHRDPTKLAVLNLSRNAVSHAALARLRAALPPTVLLIAEGQRSADAHVGDPWPDRRPSRRASGRPRRA